MTSEKLLGIIWDDKFKDISFSHHMIRDISKERIRRFIEIARKKLQFIEIRPEIATVEDLLEIHSKEYVNKLQEVSRIPFSGYLDGGDTVHYPGIFEDVLLVLGASKTALKFSSYVDYVYVPLGGFHHATYSKPMGFCPINDVAYLVFQLLMKKEKVAIVDVDAHHGNGIQEYLYDKPVLKINIFAYDGKFFPGTGRVDERGAGEGKGLNYNFPLPLGSGDDAFELALKILDIVESFSPTYIVVVSGVDGHKDDGLKSLELTCNSYNLLGLKVRRLARTSKVIGYGGGGYGRMSSECMVSFLQGLLGKKEELEVPTISSGEIIKKVKETLSLLLSFSQDFS
ncbi:acetoin utilization protein [Stygiolobus caldivivus]|uniref:Acetoin utilization protein n=1 Tax=Stygiolobus caldivivus TaxID=2824673 RepID=A0A8D5ZIA6_9CREN|nr:acetoin utilization protein [Stygiolobus caldivivus]